MRFAGADSTIQTLFGQAAKGPRQDEIAATGMQGESMERQASMQAEAQGLRSGIEGAGIVQAGKYQAEAIKAQGQAQGQQAMASGIGSMVSGIAGGFGSMMGVGGGVTPASTGFSTSLNVGQKSFNPGNFMMSGPYGAYGR